MDEALAFEEPSFDSAEDYSFDDTEILYDEADDIMGDVEMEELTFDDEVMDDVLPDEVLDTAVNQSAEETSSDWIAIMDSVEPEALEFDDQAEGSYEARPKGVDEVPADWEGAASGLEGDGLEESGIEGNVESTDAAIEPIDPSEIDYDEVFEGLDSYDFDGVDYLQDAERLDSSLGAFQPERWQELDLDQQKEAMTELAEYVQEVTGLENPPAIEFYNNPVDGDYGGYMADTNTLSINEHMLYDSNEAADTVAHELWHAYQHERAMNPQSAKDYQYQYNFEHYVSPKQDMQGRFVNFTEYQDQLVEAEARAFAEQFKGRLGGYGGEN